MKSAALPQVGTSSIDSQSPIEHKLISEFDSASNPLQSISTPIKLLLIAHNIQDASLIRKLLALAENRQFELVHIRSLPEALKFLSREAIDVILLNLPPPDGYGIDIVSQVHGAAPQVPLITLIGCNDAMLSIESLRLGAQDCIAKDQLEHHSLLRTVDYAIERHQMQARSKQQVERERMINGIAQRIRQYLSLEKILNTTVAEVRQLLQADRVFIYRLNPDWSGTIIEESVTSPWKSILGVSNHDHSFGEKYVPLYKLGRVQATEDIYTGGLDQCHIDFLAEYQIRANLVTPIVQGEKLWGLLVANQCSGPRQWQPFEISLLQQLDTQVAIAIQQSELYEQSQSELAERKRVEQQLRHNAFHDALTDLPNRALYMDRLGQALKRYRRFNTCQFAVLFLDIDRFKLVNDALGHHIGDQLLIALAQRLKSCVRPEDTVARFGGDEFAILLEDIKDASVAIQISERILQALTKPFLLKSYEIVSTTSIGIVISTTGYDDPEKLLRDADIAMYRAKNQGKAGYAIFDAAMHAQSVTQLQLETDLRQAVERQEFTVLYQPIVSLSSGRISGFEALIRWLHPTRGMVSPTEFIPVAEETGLIIPIGAWILREACAQMQAWQQQFQIAQTLTMSVNLSSRQFMQLDLVEQVNQILRESHLEPRHIKLEITESVIMERPDMAALTLKKLHESGIQISIDDFGTGYSSLSYLYRFPIDTLKLDRSFIKGIDVDGEKLALVKGIIQLARNMDMDVVAEGIETAQQLAQLKKLRSEYGQGYFFSKPLNSETATAILAEEYR
ncbi:EAL domain-containing protein [Romeria aff. gracilis LEGE 07310]|uniref:EAL domain-containing protein n=1 Tax=Vasconcelosia minhoensis LEGE 07310 TaxID=915328 RepID=A0A8J7AHL1_9CYAN|nr:EAL domain-containing protein [Romeria gracilis]MBE9077698.1 EAL domain-containing protein [Romeria aff. gracilis LEGE 07310]